jgi:hypothetical protein
MGRQIYVHVVNSQLLKNIYSDLSRTFKAAVEMKIAVAWDVMPFSLVVRYRCFP